MVFPQIGPFAGEGSGPDHLHVPADAPVSVVDDEIEPPDRAGLGSAAQTCERNIQQDSVAFLRAANGDGDFLRFGYIFGQRDNRGDFVENTGTDQQALNTEGRISRHPVREGTTVEIELDAVIIEGELSAGEKDLIVGDCQGQGEAGAVRNGQQAQGRQVLGAAPMLFSPGDLSGGEQMQIGLAATAVQRELPCQPAGNGTGFLQLVFGVKSPCLQIVGEADPFLLPENGRIVQG